MIDDDLVWACYEAMREETDCWRTVQLHPKVSIAVRDRLPLPGLNETVECTVSYEQIEFSDLDTAKRYVVWRGVKAALERSQA